MAHSELGQPPVVQVLGQVLAVGLVPGRESELLGLAREPDQALVVSVVLDLVQDLG
jgi:hypothetical protein